MEDFQIKTENNSLKETEKTIDLKKPGKMNYSTMISNENRKTQFTLGTDKPILATEAKENYKKFEIESLSNTFNLE